MKNRNSFISTHFTSRTDVFFFVCGILMLASEAWKQFTLTFAIGHGIYNWWYFPLQLCSIPMYVLAAYPWLRGMRIRRAALCFLMTYCPLGGIAVFADTTGLHYPLAALTVHSYVWHILLILIGISSGAAFLRAAAGDEKRTLFARARTALPLRPFLYGTVFYLICCLTAVLLNLTFDRYGAVNLFYINPDYRMQQVVFRDFVPLLGNTGTILLYIGSTILGAFLLFLFWALLFRLFFTRRRSRRP